ncbi:MAG: hypothetical protein KKH57_02505 [Candidatus Omnitrophica bacterium]|nr:hypothetical protein [Candidatus Omnitrophota bacterium]
MKAIVLKNMNPWQNRPRVFFLFAAESGTPADPLKPGVSRRKRHTG